MSINSFLENAPEYLNTAATVIGYASLGAASIRANKSKGIWAALVNLINLFAMNIGNSKNVAPTAIQEEKFKDIKWDK